jgi:integrase
MSFAIRKQTGGKRQQKVIGHYPIMSLSEAQTEAKRILLDVETGGNIVATATAKEHEVLTLAGCLTGYLAHRAKSSKPLKPRTSKQYADTINLYSGHMLAQAFISITAKDIADRHMMITKGQVLGQRKASPAQADLWARVIRALCNFAIREYRDVKGAQLFQEITGSLSHNNQWHHVPRKQSHIRASQLTQVLDGLDTFRAENLEYAMGIATADAIEFAIFTGLRKGEVLGLTWDRVNIKDGYFWIGETKNGAPLELPITETVLKILKRRKIATTGAYVFSPKATAIDDPRKAMRKIINTIDLDFGFHDCRRTFASNAELAGVGSYTIKRLLNHKTNRDDVTAGYIVQSSDELGKPAKAVELQLLTSANRIEEQSLSTMDEKLMLMLGSMSEDDKRKLMFSALNSQQSSSM